MTEPEDRPLREPKLFAGARIRQIREQRGLQQRDIARRLGLSPSYMNQIENDRRPVPPRLAAPLCDLLGIPLAELSGDDEVRRAGDLLEAALDPALGPGRLTFTEARAAVRDTPELARRFIALYAAYRAQQARLARDPALGRDEPGPLPPYDEVRDWVQSERNYFHEIDLAAERLAAHIHATLGPDSAALERHLAAGHRIEVVPSANLLPDGILWQIDRRNRRLLIAEEMRLETRRFSLAHVIGLLSHGRLISRLIERAKVSSDAARGIARVALANYFAGALIMPYAAFLAEAEAERYDIQRLQIRFQASFEQVCHRLSTLQRPGAQGIPFFFLKTDTAGNVLKRSSATRFRFDRFGGPCPLWNVYQAFSQPGKISVQLAQPPGETTYISIARTVGGGGTSYLSRPRAVAVGLGCEIQYAPRIVYAAGLDLDRPGAIDPIGPGCRSCPRVACRHRAMPPIDGTIDVGTAERGVVPYRVSRPPPGA
ncbi:MULTISPECIES: short-chain fatty acyl-CoA regulator family protein [Acidiphilium]|uniref:HTH cro/C1-type domain-containing protein n=4 Tax=Acidiphilium TaxID=522 RepID=A5FW23_ACICJ|nr:MULTISPECIES: XRE family transcriptional regulator [Acidiphilium]MBS3025109.1 DUF2083 domain-containing protein [Acidiphilium multivorum]MBU6356431.1 DUF2083 domain-containing protein [Rhodospirillales bacterium]ABQ29805.1 protein of unknown function DUF955 [Acidiphilium cryptum JF-5]KDM65492.1 Xre family transcriptional regulator [Acidiphilium sp. JA12-A1]MDE2327336.1 DUF2083 domain-containing protein [Rhodospirillales bacterium]